MTQKKENRNIIDHYWYWKTEAIKADLDTKRHKFGVFCSNLGNDFNIATIVRNSNAFLADKVYVYGRRTWDKRGAVGTHKYQHIEYFKEGEDFSHLKEKYTFVAIDNVDGAVPMDDFVWPENTLMFFGQEQLGLPQELIDECDHVVYIKQYGSVRSLNVGCASSIAMYDYCSKLGVEKVNHVCSNDKCRASVDEPGLCNECSRIWQETLDKVEVAKLKGAFDYP